ncbi:MAG: VTC domain-containing protein, partial [Flavobacteriales bacterium]
MSRLDQKYLIHRQWVPQLVGAIRDDYRILEVDGVRQTEYRNRFIETASQSSLHEHTRGRNIRFKARIRQYGSNLRSFLEVK